MIRKDSVYISNKDQHTYNSQAAVAHPVLWPLGTYSANKGYSPTSNPALTQTKAFTTKSGLSNHLDVYAPGYLYLLTGIHGYVLLHILKMIKP